MLDTLNYWRQGLSSPPQGIKDPGNKDVLENGTCENIKREAINCRLQVRMSLMHDRNATAFFVVMFSCKKRHLLTSPEVHF